MLDSSNWEKIGPILDQHGTVYGPGSVVFTPSVDGSEYVKREREGERREEEGKGEEEGEGEGEEREREIERKGAEDRTNPRSPWDCLWTWKCGVYPFTGWIRVCGEEERREGEEGGGGEGRREGEVGGRRWGQS